MSEVAQRRASLVTLGCARNEVDSEELAGRLGASGWVVNDAEPEDADVIVVNTCGFIDSAKKDSIDTLLAAADSGKKVVAVGCLAERYGAELAESLPEANGILGFDSYADIAARLDDVVAGRPIQAHQPRDRRELLPVVPAHRPAAAAHIEVPGHAWLPADAPVRRRLDQSPVAYLKLASGCDRRCTFCAIPSFRGSFVSRSPAEVLAEARWLAEDGVREIVLVSENSTSYGKDMGDLRALESLLGGLAKVDGISRIRVSYLQPAEMRDSLIDAIAATDGVADYFDLSFQHSNAGLLRRMKRFGSTESFLALIEKIRKAAPNAGIRSNLIVGFPGETEAEFAELQTFVEAARLDAIGVFGYSDEDGTEAAGFDGKLSSDEIDSRVSTLSSLADELVCQRAESRLGESVVVLVEQRNAEEGPTGRAGHQGPDVDGVTTLVGDDGLLDDVVPGALVTAEVVDTEGVDLYARLVSP